MLKSPKSMSLQARGLRWSDAGLPMFDVVKAIEGSHRPVDVKRPLPRPRLAAVESPSLRTRRTVMGSYGALVQPGSGEFAQLVDELRAFGFEF
jgi:hypothetical protein